VELIPCLISLNEIRWPFPEFPRRHPFAPGSVISALPLREALQTLARKPFYGSPRNATHVKAIGEKEIPPTHVDHGFPEKPGVHHLSSKPTQQSAKPTPPPHPNPPPPTPPPPPPPPPALILIVTHCPYPNFPKQTNFFRTSPSFFWVFLVFSPVYRLREIGPPGCISNCSLTVCPCFYPFLHRLEW